LLRGFTDQTVVGVPALVPVLFQADAKGEPSLSNENESTVAV